MSLIFLQKVAYLLKCGQKALQSIFYFLFIFLLQTFFQKFKTNEKFPDCERKFLHGEIIA